MTVAGAPETVGLSGIALEISAPENVRILVHEAGFLIFDFSQNSAYCGGAVPVMFVGPIDKKVAAAQEIRLALSYARTRYITAFLATLWAGGQDATFGMPVQKSVHPGNVLFAQLSGNKWAFLSSQAAVAIAAHPAQAAPMAVFENASRMFQAIHAALGPKCFELLSLVNNAMEYLSEHEFASCLLISWSVVEAIETFLWERLLSRVDKQNGGTTAINKERRKRLTGRDFTASVVAEILSMMGYIDDERLSALNEARAARNKFAHELRPVTAEQATQALQLAAVMIKDLSRSSFRVSASYAHHI